MEVNFTMEQVEELLREQKRLVIEKLLRHTAYYNPQSTDSDLKTMDLKEDKFKEIGMAANLPQDIITLKKYLK